MEMIKTSRDLTGVGSNSQAFTPFAGDSILSLKIARTTKTSNPVGSFPIPIFGKTLEESGYQDIDLKIPAGYALVITESNGNKVFTFTSGANVVAFTVSCSTISYMSALIATLQDKFNVGLTRLSVTPSTNASVQFANQVVPFYKNLFGGNKSNPLDVNTNQNPFNNLDYIIDIPQSYSIDKSRGVVFYVDVDTTALTINLGTSSYVD